MLIDDNKIDLFVSQKIIERLEIKINTRTFISATSAINYLKIIKKHMNPHTMLIPDMILLDINMPDMSGFDFFEEFKRTNIIDKEKISIYMLSSSMCPDDILKAQKETYCSGYITKPITVDKLNNLLNEPINFEYSECFKKII